MERRPASIKLPKNFQPSLVQYISSSCRGLSHHELTGRNLEAFKALLLCDKVDGFAGGHTPGQTLHTSLLEVWNGVGPVGNDSDGIRRCDKRLLSVNHVPIAIAIAGSTKGNVLRLDSLHKAVGVREVRIGVSSIEVWRWNAVLNGAFRETETLDEEGTGVRSSNTMQTVKEDGEVIDMGIKEVLDQGEIEDLFEEGDIVCHGVDDLDIAGSVLEIANLGEINLLNGCSMSKVYNWRRH